MPSRASSSATAARVVVDVLGEPARLVRDVGQLRLEAGQSIGERLEPGVEPGDAQRLVERHRRRRRGRRRPRGSAPRGARPLPGRSPRHAGRPSAWPRISSASPGRRFDRAISVASCSSRSSRRATSRGSRAAASSAARFSRQRSTAVAIAVAQVARARRTRRAGRAASARRAVDPGRAARGPRRGRRPRRPGAPPSPSHRRAGRSSGRSSRPRATAMSGSGRRSNRASTRAVSAPWRTSVVSARAPSASPSASISRLFPAPVSPVMTLNPASNSRRSRSIRARSVTVSSRSRPGADSSSAVRAHDGSSSTLWRSRSQNGWAPCGSSRRIGRSIAWTSTTSPTAIGRSSRPSTETSASCASTTRQRTTCCGLDDDGTDRREVRRDRRDDEVAADRVEDRAAGGERVARAPRRACHDETVGDERGEVRVVDADVEPADPRERAARDDDVVEREVALVVAVRAAGQDAALDAPSARRSCTRRRRCVPARTRGRAASAFDRKPTLPRLMPSSGTSTSATARAARRNVPSPPSTTRTSVDGSFVTERIEVARSVPATPRCRGAGTSRMRARRARRSPRSSGCRRTRCGSTVTCR